MLTQKSILQRLESLEKQNRIMKRTAAVTIVIAASLLVMGQAAANRTIEAREFVLRDSKGNARARLSVENSFGNDSAGLTLLRPDGTKAVVLFDNAYGTTSRNSAISFLDRDGHIRVNLKADEIASSLRFSLPDGSNQVDLGARTEVECPSPRCAQPSPKRAVAFGMSSDAGVVMLDLFDKPSINIADLDGFRATVGSTDLLVGAAGEKRQTSAASITLFGKDGKVIWSALPR